MEKYLSILKQYWGYEHFRDLQGDIIQSIGRGEDTLGLMPTGGGKSITFQVPALAMEGICIVVTPLIALMKDQVDNLKKRKIKAAAIYAGMTRQEIVVTLDNCLYGDYKFLYVSPERLFTELFLSRLSHFKVSLLAIDESHCISQWGYDFRPSYLRIAEIREHIPGVPVLALTATATPEVVKDIQVKLQFPKENVYQKSFERSNLVYVVRTVEDKLGQLLKILGSVAGTAIVYVRDRKKTKEVADFLNQNNISAEHFHAGLTHQSKDERQSRWKRNETRVIVSTNAFGMGIDKPDVRVVVHMDLPDSLEAYFQEAGRAGRDEQKAFAVLLYNKGDNTKIKKRISDSFPEKERIVITYDKLGNYFELGVGSGEGMVYAFNLIDFCTKFKLPSLQTYNAMKTLEQAGYLQLTDEIDNPSRLMFIVNRDELYNFQLNNPELDKLMQLLLRSYTGLFTEYAHIHEEALAKRLGISRPVVYDLLITLSKYGIISYIPAKKTPFVIYSQNRVESKRLYISREAYDERKDRYEKRITEMLHYATEENICRSQMLLRYFGQHTVKPCGQCDVCLKVKEKQLPDGEFDLYRNEIQKLLAQKPMSHQEILSQARGKEDNLLQTLRFMLDNGFISLAENGKMSLKN